jgi:metallo-beta-lactamase class B
LKKFALSLLLAACVVSSASADANPPISLKPLRGAVYLVEDDHYLTTNSLVYIGKTHATVIGATWTPETARLLAAEIARLTDVPVTEVINISPDPEWAGGNAYWKSIGARIHAFGATCEHMKTHWSATVEFFRSFRPAYPSLSLSLPTDCHPGDFQLQSGNVQALFLGASHTPADIFVFFKDEKILNAGSILKEQLGNMSGADVGQYPHTLRKLQRLGLGYQMIVSGHYAPLHGPELVDHYLRLLDGYIQANPAGK